MSHPAGTNIGGIVTIEDVRQRCVIDDHTGCWHCRQANGRVQPRGVRQVIWVHGRGRVSLPRGIWELHRNRRMPRGWRAFRTCDSYDCANPEHIKGGNGEAFGKVLKAKGEFKADPKRRDNARKAAESRRVVTAELLAWLLESPQSGSAAAHGLGITQSRANCLRAQARARPSSVFQLGALA